MIKDGDIIKGPFWSEPLKLDKVTKNGDYVRVIGSTLRSKTYVNQILDSQQLEKVEVINRIVDFSSKADDIFFVVEATRFRYASLFDPFLAMNTSKIDPLPFQIEAVYGYILKQPRIRFLIADDPGAGKTIMAGLVIKELKLRKIVSRILIVVPGHLKDQWRRELKERFNEKFIVLDRAIINNSYGENPWESNDQLIVSMDFAKQNDIVQSLSSAYWDLVIVDEAHKMAAYSYGNKTDKTQRYKLGEVLSKRSNHLLFLTATPHKGDSENFRLFLDLLYPGFFSSAEMLEESLKNRDNPLFIRRLKEDLRDFEGRPIFTRRFVKTIEFTLSDEEMELYNELSEYIANEYNKLKSDNKRRNAAFTIVILQRRMASSIMALLKSLERRRKKLENILKQGQTWITKESNKFTSIEDIEDLEELEEKDRWKIEEEWETLTSANNTAELRNEISTISRLIENAKRILNTERETKLSRLRQAIEQGFHEAREMNGNPKILIFTESKDTLDYLVGKIKEWGYNVNSIDGSMKMEERIDAERRFKNDTEIMVATEAAGEGINLQFCHIMINYDIPWSPVRLEQRMGRIHRYGQQKDVHIFNFVASNTREGQVLFQLLEKLDEIKENLGSDKVFDVIGEIFPEDKFYDLITNAIVKAKSMDEILSEIDIKVDVDYIAKIKAILSESLATKFIDYTKIREMMEKSEEYRLVPEYVERFFKRGFVKAGGKFNQTKDAFITIDSMPYDIREISEGVDFKNRFGTVGKSYRKITFDKEKAFKNPDAEFVSFGHPLFEALLEYLLKAFGDSAMNGATFRDPSGRYEGLIWFYIAEVKDGKGEVAGRKIITLYEHGNKCCEIGPSILWDLAPLDNPNEQSQNLEDQEGVVLSFVINAVQKYKEELSIERERQARIKEKYGLKSLEQIIWDLDRDILKLEENMKSGQDTQLAIRNKKEQLKKYTQNKETLAKEIEQERSLTISIPELLTVVRVIPDKAEMVEDEDIEKIGMQVVTEYEKSQGRIPEDVSKENLGFDIRSKDQKEVRYIEVKARAGIGNVALTPNEWYKASILKDKYWLYIVTGASTKPVLHIVRNPAENLKAIEELGTVMYVVNFSEWKDKETEVIQWKQKTRDS